ncbi:probable cytochrome P450 6a13 [Sitodiplosis mosellana]|uniref:probable cytochrome P450 6a13 n=1 Tax=Sitodiplosis mosellana TaxID=263140 RepID=UPI002444E4BB|nr:probable cytochrome P450 6a13 [Sitodiplosis mosellana]
MKFMFPTVIEVGERFKDCLIDVVQQNDELEIKDAGFETLSTTLSYCLYELALNPEIQEKARQVIQDAFEKHGMFTYEMMLGMPYIDHILQETLRMYPPLSNLNRKTMNDYQVPGSNHVIRKGLMVMIPIFAIQRDSQYYPDPESSIQTVSMRKK